MTSNIICVLRLSKSHFECPNFDGKILRCAIVGTAFELTGKAQERFVGDEKIARRCLAQIVDLTRQVTEYTTKNVPE